MWKDYIHLHFIVFIYGFTGILGKLITIPATELVSYRMLIAALCIGVYAWIKKERMVNFTLRDGVYISFVGLVVAAHWITFFYAIDISNVSVVLGCFATTTLFTSLLEPLVMKKKVSLIEVVLGIVVIISLYLILQFAWQYWQGILWALLSSFLGSLFGVLNKQLTAKHSPTVISFIEMLVGGACAVAFVLLSGGYQIAPWQIEPIQTLYILALALVATTYAFLATVELLKRLSAYSVALVINLEPVYAICMALLIFRESEKMGAGFYIGTAILILSVMSYPLLKKLENPQAALRKSS